MRPSLPRGMASAIALASMLIAFEATGAESIPNQPSAGAKDQVLKSQNGMSASDYAECVSDLSLKNDVFEKTGAATDAGCQLTGAIRLASVATSFGVVTIAGKPVMLCSFGRQFGAWVRDVAAPLTLAYTGRKLAQIDAGQSFTCRARRDKPGSIPSEHAKGDAIDIGGFVLADAHRIGVKEQPSDTPLERDFVRALRTSACGYFTTVLGPGSDAAHAEHLHFDTGIHGATPNYRICE
jgi:hypothetical protein